MIQFWLMLWLFSWSFPHFVSDSTRNKTLKSFLCFTNKPVCARVHNSTRIKLIKKQHQQQQTTTIAVTKDINIVIKTAIYGFEIHKHWAERTGTKLKSCSKTALNVTHFTNEFSFGFYFRRFRALSVNMQ